MMQYPSRSRNTSTSVVSRKSNIYEKLGFCFAYHKRHAKFVRHNIVKDWIDRRGHVIENAWHVGH